MAYESIDSQAGDRIGTLADDGSTARGLGAMIQTEDGAHINPVPAREGLALGAEFLGLAPVIALANIPGVDFNNQSKGLRGRPLAGGGQMLELLPRVELSQSRWPGRPPL